MITEQTKENPTYYAVIPATVRYDNRLTMGAKMMYGEITCLSNKLGYCWASNRYFANLYNVHENTIQNWITSLKRCGYVKVDTKQNQSGSMRKIYLSQSHLIVIPQSQPVVIN